MDFGGFVFFAIVIAIIGISFYAAYVRNREAEQQREIEENRRQRREAEMASEATAVWLEIKEAFPFLPTPTIEEPTAKKIYERIGALIYGRPHLGRIAGTPLPAPSLPAVERRRHLYVVGKTGSGKSTFLEHLIKEDLEDDR